MLISFFIVPKQADALTYQDIDQYDARYNISNFKLEGNDILINGWAMVERHQNYLNDSTHQYSIVLTNNKTGISKEYIGKLLNVDKTRLLKVNEQKWVCTATYSKEKCYYQYLNVGFEFKIPLSDLELDSDYRIKVRIFEKTVNKGYQFSIYVMGIDDNYDRDGVKYQLYSDIKKTSVKTNTSSLFVRSGPGQNYSIRQSNITCSGNGKTLYWYPKEVFTNIKGAQQNNPGAVSSELWVNVAFNFGGCYNGKARAVNGTSQNGWAPWIYMVGGGDPAIIRVMSLDVITVDEIKAYTVPKDTQTKTLLTLTSKQNQDIQIKAYHNDSLVYNSNEKLSGTKTFTINYNIPNNGTLKIEIINKYRTISASTKTYISSEEEFIIDSSQSSGLVEVSTPILVITDKNGNATEYKEKIQLSAVPYDIELSQGRGISGITSAISYWYPLEEFALNSDYTIYALYPSQEETLKNEIENGKVKVILKKDNIVRNNDHDISYFYHPNILLSLIDGNLYSEVENGIHYFNGGEIWYPSWDDEVGQYDYQYIGVNLGINKISIKRDLTYTITNTMFGEEGKFIIKRVENPSNRNIIFNQKFTYEELLEYINN